MSADQLLHGNRTKYKRLVNNIYPRNASDGLQRNEMTKLCFYVITEPQKLDRVFDYISKKTLQFVRRKKDRKYVDLSLKAMDELMTVSSNQMPLFVNVYLKTLQRLLECGDDNNDLELLTMTLRPFEHFCEIREETINYQRSYSAFVDRFGSLAHRECSQAAEDMEKFRVVGLRGLRAIIRKLGNDDNQSTLWAIMPKVMPSLIFNMQPDRGASKQCLSLAENISQDLFVRIQGNLHLANCLKPLLFYLDNHGLWTNQPFCRHLFDLIVNTVSTTTAHAVLAHLLAHVEQHLSNISLRKDVLGVARYYLNRSRSDFLGSHIYTCLRQLMIYLKASENDPAFEQAALDTIVDLAVCSAQQSSAIQTMESVMYMLNEVPINPNDESQLRLQLILLRTVNKILSQSVIKPDFLLPSLSLFDPLISLLQVDSAEARLRAAQILTAIFDRAHCADRLKAGLPWNITSDMAEQPKKNLSIRITDAEFVSRFGTSFMQAVQVSLELADNRQENVDALLLLCVLFYKEYSHEASVLGRVIRTCLEIQESCLQQSGPLFLHGFVAALLHAVGCFSKDPGLSAYVDGVVALRRKRFLQLLSLNVNVTADEPISADLLFDASRLPDYREQGKIKFTAEELATTAESGTSAFEQSRSKVERDCVTVERLKNAFYSGLMFPGQRPPRSDSSIILERWLNGPLDMAHLKKELKANRRSKDEKRKLLDEIMSASTTEARSKRLLTRIFAF